MRRTFTLFVHPAIRSLFLASCPAAIMRSVWTVCVDAVDRFAKGAFSHVGKEVGEQLPPFFNANPPAAVVVEVFIARVSAALKHCVPTVVCAAGALAVWGVPMLSEGRHSSFGADASGKAPARFGPAAFEFVAGHYGFGAAVANALPCGEGPDSASAFKHKKFPESERSQVNGVWCSHG